MSDDSRRVIEHLGNGSLYESGVPAGGEWRRRLLANRFPFRPETRQARGLDPALRMHLLVTLPLVACALFAFYSAGGGEILSAWMPKIPVPTLPDLSLGNLGAGAMESLWTRLVGEKFAGKPLWLPLTLLGGGLSTLVTFALRGRAPRLLPLDW